MDLSGLFNKDPHINPYHEALQNGLKNYGDIAKLAYQVQQTQADIKYKNALSDWMKFNKEKMIQTNPILAANRDPDNSGGGAAQPAPLQNGQQNPEPTQTASGNKSMLSSIGDWMHKITGGNTSQPPQPSQVPKEPSDGVDTVQAPDNWDGDIAKLPKPSGNNNPDRGYALDNNGRNITGNPNDVKIPGEKENYNPDWQYQSSSGIRPLDLSDPKYNIGPANAPKAIRIARAKDPSWQTPEAASAIAAQKEGAVKRAAVEAEGDQKYLAETYKSVKAAQDFKVSYHDAFNALKKAHIKGPIAGLSPTNWLAKFDPNYSNAVASANAAVINSIDQIAAKPSDMRTGLLIESKFNPNAPLKSGEHWVKKNDLITDRAIEQNGFNNYAEKHGIVGNERRSAWDDYNIQYPIVNKQGRLISVNLGKYENYLDHKYGGKKVGEPSRETKSSGEESKAHWKWNGSGYTQ